MTSFVGLLMIAVLAITAGALAWGALVDLRRFIIPNRVSATVTAAFLIMALLMPRGFLFGGLLTGLGVLAVGAFVFARGWMGGGDVKLLAATSLWAGPSMLAPFTMTIAMAGGALALLILSPVGQLMPAHPSADPSQPVGRKPMPFGVAIACGGLWVIVQRFLATR